MNNLSKIFLIIIIILSITVCIMAGIFIKVREINNNNVERLLNIFEDNLSWYLINCIYLCMVFY